ncbi:heme-binding domain-containing protein [Sediminibacterium sp.]|uniref:heme-binding domain-containing protein n=1 Tax=Sediminibacterium sp. TaxID=1917865 RepID=UPI003F72444A
MLKKVLVGLFVVLLVLQAFRPVKNNAANKENDISTLYPVPENVEQILTKACNDCHSNNTVYPWYAEVQPIAWWLDDHVKDGKKHLNFNEFASYRLAKQYHKLEEVFDEVKGGEMPLESYTVVHRDAKLTEEEKSILMDWSVAVRDSMKARFPADSLILKKTK